MGVTRFTPLGAGLVAIFAAGFGAPAAAQTASRPKHKLRIASYNVTNLTASTARDRLNALVDNLERLDADLIFLQEVSTTSAVRRLMRELHRRPIERYETYRIVNTSNPQDVVLLSRYPPTRFARHNFPGVGTYLDRAVYADFTFGRKKLRVVSTHLKAGIRNAADARTRNRQTRSLVRSLVRPALTRGDYVIVCGDLNDIDPQVRYPNGRRPSYASEVFEILRRDAPELRNLDADLPLNQRVTSGLGYMYDHFVVDKRLAARISVDNSPQLARWASDHYPLILDVAPLGATPVRKSAEPSRSIPSNGSTLSHSITVNGSGKKILKGVSVRVYLTHPKPGDLEIQLTHGGKTTTLLAEGEVSNRSRTFDRRVVTRRFQGLSVGGRWTLKVTFKGSSGGSGGVLRKWELVTAADD